MCGRRNDGGRHGRDRERWCATGAHADHRVEGGGRRVRVDGGIVGALGEGQGLQVESIARAPVHLEVVRVVGGVAVQLEAVGDAHPRVGEDAPAARHAPLADQRRRAFDRNGLDRVRQRVGVEAEDHCAAGHVEVDDVRGAPVGRPEGAVADKIHGEPGIRLADDVVALNERPRGVEPQDRAPGGDQNTSVRKHAQSVRLAARKGNGIEVRKLLVGAEVELLHVRPLGRVEHRAGVAREVDPAGAPHLRGRVVGCHHAPGRVELQRVGGAVHLSSEGVSRVVEDDGAGIAVVTRAELTRGGAVGSPLLNAVSQQAEVVRTVMGHVEVPGGIEPHPLGLARDRPHQHHLERSIGPAPLHLARVKRDEDVARGEGIRSRVSRKRQGSAGENNCK